jgi:predicted DsbA family dithiol-disulfide isomerase
VQANMWGSLAVAVPVVVVPSGVQTATRGDPPAEVDQGSPTGVTARPAFFINGRLLSGAQPLEQFVQLIEDELARAG